MTDNGDRDGDRKLGVFDIATSWPARISKSGIAHGWREPYRVWNSRGSEATGRRVQK